MGEVSYEARKRPLESDLPEQIEVRVRRERLQRWTAADKLRIVEKAFASGAVAKRGCGTARDQHRLVVHVATPADGECERGFRAGAVDGGSCRGSFGAMWSDSTPEWAGVRRYRHEEGLPFVGC
jgi:hypothetical protein